MVDESHFPTPRVTHAQVLRLAGPIVLSNISTPLLGIADMVVIGRIPNPAALGAIALGGTIFNFVYWGFGFLRMGTTGLTAQAVGASDAPEVSANLGRALLIALAIGLSLIALQWPIGLAAFALLKGSPDVQTMAHDFFAIRIWSAPFTLANFAILGWFIGRQKANVALVLQVFMNGINIVLNVTFVAVLGWAVKGVATGTVIAEIAATGLGLFLAARNLKSVGRHWEWPRLLDREKLGRMIAVNRDIMIRTFCLIFAFAFFTSQGARSGDVLLAANAVLGQFIAVSAFLLDAFGFAAEALVGQAVGARERATLDQAVRLSALWAGGVAFALSLGLLVAGPPLHRYADNLIRGARGGAALPALGGCGAFCGGLVLPARRHIHRGDAVGRNAQRHGAVARHLSRRMVAACGALRQSRALGGPDPFLPGARGDAFAALSRHRESGHARSRRHISVKRSSTSSGGRPSLAR